jgi:hypothetical protein
MPENDDLLTEIHGKVCAIDERTKAHTERLKELSGSVSDHGEAIASLRTTTKNHGESIKEIKTRAFGLGLLGGIFPGGIWQAIKAALGNS